MPAARAVSASLRAPELKALGKGIDRLTMGAAGPAPPVETPRIGVLLVALDGSPGSRLALDWAAWLAPALKARIELVAVAPARPAHAGSEWGLLLDLAEQSEAEARKALDAAKADLARGGLDANAFLARGSPASRIVARAKAVGADLVLMGSHRKDPIGLGSVASAVRHQTAASVLIARGPPKGPVLAATDGSPTSRRATAVGVAWAKALGGRATVLHSLHVPLFGGSAVAAEDEALDRVLEHGGAAGEDAVAQYSIMKGPPAAAILEAARAMRAGLAVVGSRGLGGLRSLVLGSVSDKVSRDAPCSVLVVKP